MFSMQSVSSNPLNATFQLSSAASLNLGQSQYVVLGNGFTKKWVIELFYPQYYQIILLFDNDWEFFFEIFKYRWNRIKILVSSNLHCSHIVFYLIVKYNAFGLCLKYQSS